MSNYFFLCLSALALAGCASGPLNHETPGPAAGAAGLTAAPARITDSRLHADRATLAAVQTRLRRLNEAGVAQGHYALAKAQCWLDTARTQYEENDRTGYIEESLTESVRIAQALEADRATQAGHATPLVARSTRLRDDLWVQLGQFKSQGSTLACTARTVACAEVRLVRAGHAEQQTGWRQATPHVQMVEDAVRLARVQAASCVPQPVAASGAKVISTAVVAASGVSPVTAPTVVVRESFTLPGDALFQFGKSDVAGLLPGGRERLATLAGKLKAYRTIQTVHVVGHTDRLGSETFNDHLSSARATTVLTFLESLGVKAISSVARGAGKREPVTTWCGDNLPRTALVVCLQPDRRVAIDVRGFK